VNSARQLSVHEIQREYRFLKMILFLIAMRPIIDLHGKYEGEGINAGGVLGFIVACMILVEFFTRVKRWSYQMAFVILAALTVLLVGLIHLLVEPNILDVSVTFSRFFVGFSALLIIPLLQQQRPEVQQELLLLFFKVLLLASTIPAIIAWLQFLGLHPFSYYDYVFGLPYGRPTGGYGQPNSLGRLLVFVSIVTYIVSLTNRIKASARVAILGVAFSTAYISTHRTSILILALMIVLFELRSLLFLTHRLAFRKIYLVMLCLFLVYILATLLSDRVQRLIDPATTERVTYTTELVSKSLDHLLGYRITDEDYLRGRGQMWRMTIELMEKVPFSAIIAGIGHEPIEAHNDFLRIYMVHGVLGLICYMSIFLILFVSSWRRVDSTGKWALLALYVYLLLFSIPLHPTNYPYFMWLFFVCHAFIACQPWRLTSRSGVIALSGAVPCPPFSPHLPK
jgi:hypothetical protein